MFSSVFASVILLAAGFITVKADVKTGQATWYVPADVMSRTSIGACGTKISADEYIVAVAHGAFDSYPGATPDDSNNNPICGKKLTAHYQGFSVNATVVDRCADCSGDFDIDLSPVAFEKLASKDVGRLDGVTWDWDEDSSPSTPPPGSPPSDQIPSTDSTTPERRKMIKRRRSVPP